MPEAPRARANVEVKARCEDLDTARERALQLDPKRVGVDHQVDTYFRTRAGRLKLRESSLSGAQLIPYLRADRMGPRRSDYRVIPVDDPEGVKRLFTEVLGVECVVEKEREILIHENVRIHLDRVKGLGTFLELEAVFGGNPEAEAEQRRKVAFLMKKLGVQERDLVEHSYEQLVRRS